MAEIDVLANDESVGEAPVIEITSAPGRGTATVLNNGTPLARVLWTDTGTGAGSTSFGYRVTRFEDGKSGTATCSLTINAFELPSFAESGPQNQVGSPSNDLVLTFPTGTQQKDLLLAHVTIHGSAGGQAVATPGGWAKIAERLDANLFAAVFSRSATAGDIGVSPTTTVTFNWDAVNSGSPTPSPIIIGAIRRYAPFVAGHDLATDNAVTAAGLGATINFPDVPIAGTQRRVVAFVGLDDNCSSSTDPTGETVGDWRFRAQNSTTTGDDTCTLLYDVGMPLGNTVSGGTVAQNQAPTRWNCIAFGVYETPPVAVPPAGLYVSTTGNDTTGDGTFALPYATIEKAMSLATSGVRINMRGGTYRRTIGVTWTKSGTSSDRIVVASYPGEVATFDFNLAVFQSSGGWTLFDAPTATYRSAASYDSPDVWIGSIIIGGTNYRLLRYQTLTALQSTTYTWRSDGEFYRGPGFIVHSDSRIYIRIQNLASPRDAGVPAAAPVGAAIRNTPPSGSPGGFDPNDYVINLGKVGDNLTIQGSNLTFERLAFIGGDRGVVMNGRSGITFQNCRFWNQRTIIRLENGNSNIQVLGCDVDNAYPPWISWNDVKIDDAHHPGMKLTFFSIDTNNNNITVQDCRIRSAFDGMTTPGNTCDGIKVNNNTWDFLFDDLVQHGGCKNLEIAYNWVKGPGPGADGGTSNTAATKWFHHNVLDLRRDEFGWRLGMESNNGGGTAWRDSHAAFPSHSLSGSNTPAKVYNNTILIEANPNNTGSRIERPLDDKTGGVHSAFNNIVIQYSDREMSRNVTIGSTDQEIDYTLFWKPNGGSFVHYNDWPGGDYATLATWKASASFTSSKSVYAPGFENSAKYGDPQLGNVDGGDFRPNAAGIAATGAKDLSGAGWPGGTADGYFGAVSPDASTGLGAVGARGTPGP